jgi:hypothetical protein
VVAQRDATARELSSLAARRRATAAYGAPGGPIKPDTSKDR